VPGIFNITGLSDILQTYFDNNPVKRTRWSWRAVSASSKVYLTLLTCTCI